MKYFKRTVEFLIRSNLFIGLCAVAMVLTGRLLLPIGYLPFPVALLVAVGCATCLIYNLTQFIIDTQAAKRGVTGTSSWYNQHRRPLQRLLLICLGAFIASLFFMRWSAIFVLAFLGILSLLYNIPDHFIHRYYKSLRTIPLIKIFVIAFVWATIGSWLPFYWTSAAWQAVGALFASQFCFIMAITLPFDIRDHKQDKASRLLTIPGVIGIEKTRWLSLFFLLLHLLIMLVWFSHTAVATILLTVITAPLLFLSSAQKPYWYFTGLIDGLIIVQYLFLVATI